MIKVNNMMNNKNNEVKNQFEIYVNGARIFQSYNSTICAVVNGTVYISETYYKYSSTTSKYLSIFLNSDSKSIAKDIKNGKIFLVSHDFLNEMISNSMMGV